MNIKSRDISVVVQGRVEKELTAICLASVRKYLPDAQLILSTYKGTDTDGLEFDDLVLSDDPGAIKFNKKEYCNINRMLTTSKAGIACAARPYILKLRSDLELRSLDFINYFSKYDKFDDDYRIYKERILCSILFTLKFEESGEKHMDIPFHVSDWWYFGRTEDIRKLYSVDLVEEPYFSRYFQYHPKPEGRVEIFPERLWRMSPEQYILSSLVKKNIPTLDFETMFDNSLEILEISERFIVNNYIPLSSSMSGIYNNKSSYLKTNDNFSGVYKDGLYSERIWMKSYKKFCDEKFEFPKQYEFEFFKEELRCYKKLKKHYTRAMTPFVCTLKWVGDVFASLKYAVKTVFNFVIFFLKYLSKTR